MATLMEETYKYRPLTKSDSIRLIALQPSLDHTAIIECYIIHTTLREARGEIHDHYTALSYVWGDATKRIEILVDDRAFWITHGLYNALSHLRDQKRVLDVWADAICINQENDLEKSHQVQQMGTIYTTAHHTIIFLGESRSNQDSILRTIFASSEAKAEDWGPQTSQEIEALDNVMKSPWFYRVWIFQELILSQFPYIQYGSFRIFWDEFCCLV